jgi:hypothetical protein
MRLSWLVFLFFLCPFITMAQNGIITGKVVAKDSKSPIARASVFLSNSSFGTITSADGDFTLNNLRPGQYTLVVTILGYADYTQTVLVTETPIKLNIEMEQKAIELHEVVISNSSRADWRRNYAQFVKEFIGIDQNAKYCEIINPQILNFTYHKTQQVLVAYTDDFLIVENRGLGYRVKFLLKNFKSDKIAGIISYEGQRLFEELPGNASQKKKWMENRNLSYYGSAMHFYRALYTDKLKEEGFEARKLTRMLNPQRPPEETIQRKIPMFKSMNKIDSANYWIGLENLPLYAHQKVADIPWDSFELLRTTEQPGIFAITFPDYLYVIYTKKREETPFKDLYVPLNMPNYEISVVTLLNKERYALFDKNGIVVDQSPLYEGTWSKSRLSQLLPVDYVPSDKP